MGSSTLDYHMQPFVLPDGLDEPIYIRKHSASDFGSDADGLNRTPAIHVHSCDYESHVVADGAAIYSPDELDYTPLKRVTQNRERHSDRRSPHRAQGGSQADVAEAVASPARSRKITLPLTQRPLHKENDANKKVAVYIFLIVNVNISLIYVGFLGTW